MSSGRLSAILCVEVVCWYREVGVGRCSGRDRCSLTLDWPRKWVAAIMPTKKTVQNHHSVQRTSAGACGVQLPQHDIRILQDTRSLPIQTLTMVSFVPYDTRCESFYVRAHHFPRFARIRHQEHMFRWIPGNACATTPQQRTFKCFIIIPNDFCYFCWLVRARVSTPDRPNDQNERRTADWMEWMTRTENG